MVVGIEVGARVYARWPGSSLFYEGTVVDKNDIEYLVKFDDEDNSELPVKYKDVNLAMSFRSRSRSRGRSPSRKSPARSPARRRITNLQKKEQKPETPQEKTPEKQVRLARKSTRSPARAANNVDQVKNDVVREAVRQSVRIASMEVTRLEVNNTNSITQTFSSEKVENNNIKVSESLPVKACPVGILKGCLSKVGSFFAALWAYVGPTILYTPFLVVLLLLPLVLLQACTKKHCDFTVLPDFPTKPEMYYDSRAAGILGSGLALTLLLCFVPLKARVLNNGAKHRPLGLLSLIVIAGIVALVSYHKLAKTTVIYTLQRPLLVAHTAAAVLIGLCLYIMAGLGGRRALLNPHTKGAILPDLLGGREMQPRIGSVDVLIVLRRYSLILTALMLGELLHNQQDVLANIPLLVVVAMQLVSCVDGLMFEGCFLSSFSYNSTGLGLASVSSCLTAPFFAMLTARQVNSYPPPLNQYALVACSLLFCVGLLLTRLSEYQKSCFRANASDPKLQHLETLPTSAGPRLIVSSYWGCVRHPNDVGTLVKHAALALTAGCVVPMACVVLALETLSVLYRVAAKEKACQAKYGLSWTNYSTRVKSKLIPRVF